jgi:hypothetical protein
MNNPAWIILIAFYLMSCSGSRETTSTKNDIPVVKPRPTWISERPIAPAYYIGIGSANKIQDPLEFQQVAKKNALNDLSSEIKVLVQGESFLSTLEQNYSFSEEFRTDIRTSVAQEIESFETVDSWENGSEYWVYYRLSKAEYERIQQEKKNNAMMLAFNHLTSGKSSEDRNDAAGAFDQYVRGLIALKNYWGEKNEYFTETDSFLLDMELYKCLRDIAGSLALELPQEDIVLNAANNYRMDLPVLVLRNGSGISGVPVTYSYEKDKFFSPKTTISDREGKVLIPISDINLKAKDLRLRLEINLEALAPKEIERKAEDPILAGLNGEKKEVPIRVDLPVITIDSRELSFGENIGTRVLADAMSSNLSSQGFKVAGLREKGDYSIIIEANTTQGGTSQGFHVAYLDMSIAVRNIKSGEEIFRRAYSQLKGLQLNFENAGKEAYKKGAGKINEEVVKELLEQLL